MEFFGEKLVIRLWETVTGKGIGTLLSPWKTRREGRARTDVRREELLMLAQTARDAEDIQAGRKSLAADYQLQEHPEQAPLALREDSAFRDAAASVKRNRIAQEVRAEVNVSKALLSAEAGLEDDPQTPPERKVDDDWLFRWRDAASVVSAEELQTLWGRVLAGEIKSPGSFSLRTLEFLKNLSHEEALQITKMSPFVINRDALLRDNKLLDSLGITLDFLLNIQDLGILFGVDALGIEQTISSRNTEKFEQSIVSHNRVLMVTHEDAGKKINLKIYALTSLGRQVLELGSFEAHDVYLRSVGQTICDQGFKVQIARYKQVTETTAHYFEAEEICAKSV